MTHQENLEAVRRACIEANPEIVELKFGCGIEYGKQLPSYCLYGGVVSSGDIVLYLYTQCESIRVSKYQFRLFGEVLGRPIRLADVLLAVRRVRLEIDNIPDHLSMGVSNVGWRTWNLRKDSLEDQAEETVAFLATLLK